MASLELRVIVVHGDEKCRKKVIFSGMATKVREILVRSRKMCESKRPLSDKCRYQFYVDVVLLCNLKQKQNKTTNKLCQNFHPIN